MRALLQIDYHLDEVQVLLENGTRYSYRKSTEEVFEYLSPDTLVPITDPKIIEFVSLCRAYSFDSFNFEPELGWQTLFEDLDMTLVDIPRYNLEKHLAEKCNHEIPIPFGEMPWLQYESTYHHTLI